MVASQEGKRVDDFYSNERIVRMILDHKRRLERLEEEMDTARALIAQEIKNRINGIEERARE